MSVFHLIKKSNDLSTVKECNGFLRYSIKLAEMNVNDIFLNDCINMHKYPKCYWKILRRNHISPNSKSLKSHAPNAIDSIRSYIQLLEFTTS